MPYIRQDDREGITGPLSEALSAIVEPGQLAYAIYYLVKNFTVQLNYARAASVVGVLETVKAEWIRRELNPYEDAKRDLNGDV